MSRVKKKMWSVGPSAALGAELRASVLTCSPGSRQSCENNWTSSCWHSGYWNTGGGNREGSGWSHRREGREKWSSRASPRSQRSEQELKGSVSTSREWRGQGNSTDSGWEVWPRSACSREGVWPLDIRGQSWGGGGYPVRLERAMCFIVSSLGILDWRLNIHSFLIPCVRHCVQCRPTLMYSWTNNTGSMSLSFSLCV